MEFEPSVDRSRLEWLAVAALTAIGFALRSWPIGGLGLTHFDEGIYALVASWSLQPNGLAGLDPSLIPYAPPGYPILGGVAYFVLGRSDGAMIAVSQMAGTMTIPVTAWLGKRTFGSGVGFASATFCTFSGPHIAFSRMALTDASFLLAWLIAIGAGMRFLERPGVVRAILMGLAVGLAQQFKYNGWLVGGIIAASAAWGILVRQEERKAVLILRTFGWGGLGAVVAGLVVWPWYAFVEAHGGYPALLRHQRSYLNGWREWWPNLLTQADESVAVSDFRLMGCAIFTALWTLRIARPASLVAAAKEFSRLGLVLWLILFLLAAWPAVFAPYWLGLLIAPWLVIGRSSPGRLLGIWWLVLSVLTPFYHPYARLWLPYHAVNWLFLGFLAVHGLPAFSRYLKALGKFHHSAEDRAWLAPRLVVVGVSVALGSAILVSSLLRFPSPQPGLLAPSDSLYRATARVAEVLPDEVRVLRVLARRPVAYYLAGRLPIALMAGSDQLLERGDSRDWALIDSAILESETGASRSVPRRSLVDRFAQSWEVVEEIPTRPSLPTLLDMNPNAARSRSVDRSYPLWLLRPRTAKAPR